MKNLIPGILLLVSCASNATTINFDSMTPGLIATQTFDVGDYQFDFNGPFDPQSSPWAIGGVNNELSWADGQGSVGLEQGSDEIFGLTSIDLGGWGPDIQLSVIGYLAGSGTVQLNYVSVISGLETVSLGSQWSNLTRVEFTATGCCALVDNIIVSSVVPIPAAGWLFGSALAGLGWLRRKQSV